MRSIIATLRGPLIHTSLDLSPRPSVNVQIPPDLRLKTKRSENGLSPPSLSPRAATPSTPTPPARYIHNHQGKFTYLKYGFFLADSNENSAAAHWVPWSYILSTGTRLASVIANFAPILSDQKKGPRFLPTKTDFRHDFKMAI